MLIDLSFDLLKVTTSTVTAAVSLLINKLRIEVKGDRKREEEVSYFID